MNYTIYNPSTGEITSILTLSIANSADPNLQDKNYIEGQYDGQKYYIENSQAVAKPQNPSNGINNYNFDYATKSYVLDLEQTTIQARKYRNHLLTTIDRVNPVWFASLTQEQQQELVSYRQTLLNVPQQTGFPITIDWPIKPTWL